MEIVENIEDIGTLQRMTKEFLDAAGSFAIKVVICFLVYFIGSKVIRWAANAVRKMMEKSGVRTGVITFTVSAIRILLYTCLILWIAMQFGLKESSVAAIVASGGVGIGLALQGGLSNLAGGVQILMFHPFQIGDYIIAQENEGSVQKIELLHTTLQTMDNRKIIVPNGNLANDVIVNVTASDKRRLEIKVGISYEDSIKKAKEILQKLVDQEERILHDQEKLIFVSELGESSVILGLRVWVKTDQYFPVYWSMNEKIKEEFDRQEIHIPYPQMDVHIVK